MTFLYRQWVLLQCDGLINNMFAIIIRLNQRNDNLKAPKMVLKLISYLEFFITDREKGMKYK